MMTRRIERQQGTCRLQFFSSPPPPPGPPGPPRGEATVPGCWGECLANRATRRCTSWSVRSRSVGRRPELPWATCTVVSEPPKLQALVYDILPSTTAVFSYAIGSSKLSANEQFFAGAQTAVSLLQTTQIKQGVTFIAANKVYTSANKTTIV